MYPKTYKEEGVVLQGYKIKVFFIFIFISL